MYDVIIQIFTYCMLKVMERIVFNHIKLFLIYPLSHTIIPDTLLKRIFLNVDKYLRMTRTIV